MQRVFCASNNKDDNVRVQRYNFENKIIVDQFALEWTYHDNLAQISNQ